MVGTGSVTGGGLGSVVATVVGGTVVLGTAGTVDVVEATVVTVAEGDAAPPLAHDAMSTAPTRAGTRPRADLMRCSWTVLAMSFSDAIWAVLMAAGAFALLWLAYRMNAGTRVHRRAEDGSWFSCDVQEVAPSGETVGRWRPARAEVVAGGLTIVGTVAGDDLRPGDAPHPVVGRSGSPPRGWAVFLLGGDPILAVRVPDGSPTAAEIEALRLDR